MDKKVLLLNQQCRFHYGDEPNAWQAWYEDDSWEKVKLPHDWSVHMPFSKNYSSGTGYLAGGIGWYRIHIPANKDWEGKSISITFDGVYKNSRVYCNSYYLGERPNGYISFTYDITDFMHFDMENVISVYVDRREVADSRWFTGSGIIGGVSLTVQEKIHPDVYGIFFTTPKADDKCADYTIEAQWVNDFDVDKNIEICYELVDDKGQVKSSVKTNLLVPANSKVKHEVKGVIEEPVLWSTENPNLYTLKTKVSVDDKTVVSDCQRVGIRTFKFDPDKGFFLNGKSTVFKGVCLHHDAGVLGAAVPPAVWYQRLLKLKEMGCNSIRMSHNPHVPELYDLCDSMGFMVMDEAFDEWEGPKNKWSTGHNVYPPKHEGYYVNFNTWGEKDLTDMILRDRNHPSVIMWSIGNEIDYPNDPYCNASFKSMTGNNDANKPEAERIFNPKRPDAKRLKVLAEKLEAIVRKTDTTHPVTLAAAFPELSANIGFIDGLDVVGYNYRENLYEESHNKYKDKPFLGSENGHGLAQWKAVTDNEYISGQFLWTGIDYLGEAHGWPIRGSQAGIITVAGFEKPLYYRRQSFWSLEPMVHLTTIRECDSRKTVWGQEFETAEECEFSNVIECWNYEKGELVTIKCYTNQSKVELFLNDKSLGVFDKNPEYDSIVVNVNYEPGKLVAHALDADGKIVAEHTLYSTKAASSISIDEFVVDNSLLPLKEVFEENETHSFSNLYRFDITLTDEDRKKVVDDDREITVKVMDGELLGLESGDLSDVTPYTSASRKTYRGQAVAYVLADNCDVKPQISVRF